MPKNSTLYKMIIKGNLNKIEKEVKEEISLLDFPNHCAKSLLSSYLKNSLEIRIIDGEIKWEILSQSPFILRFIYKLLMQLYDVDKEFLFSEKKLPKILHYTKW